MGRASEHFRVLENWEWASPRLNNLRVVTWSGEIESLAGRSSPRSTASGGVRGVLPSGSRNYSGWAALANLAGTHPAHIYTYSDFIGGAEWAPAFDRRVICTRSEVEGWEMAEEVELRGAREGGRGQRDRDRESEREWERERDRQTDRERERKREPERDRELHWLASHVLRVPPLPRWVRRGVSLLVWCAAPSSGAF